MSQTIIKGLTINGGSVVVNPLQSAGWVRPTDWLEFPEVLNISDETLYVLVAVFEDDYNRITMRCDSTSALIEWGDGTTQVPTSFTTYNKVYDYTTISSSIYQYIDGRNYKQVMIKVSGTNITGIIMYNNSGTINTNGVSNSLDIYGSLPNITIFSISAAIIHPYLERVRLISTSTSVSFFQAFTFCSRLKVIEIPNYSYITNTFAMFNYTGIEKIGDFNIINAADCRNLFSSSQLKEIGNITATNITTNLGSSICSICQNLTTVGNVNIRSTNLASLFQNCNNLLKIGTITIPATCTTIANMFSNCVLIDTIIFSGDMSGITTTTTTFNRCSNLRKLIMPDITVGFSIAQCQLGPQELNDLFTSIGTANGSQAIVITGNPGTATCDTSIATNKGWTVTV